jgi:U1 zinc finger
VYVFGSRLACSIAYISQRYTLTAQRPRVTPPMSEYWVSKKRYFCKYCDVYIADDVPSRQHHENGLRHKGNVERFVRGLYKAGEKRKKDAEEEKREMRRIEQVRFYSFSTYIYLILSLQRLPVRHSLRMLALVEHNSRRPRVPLLLPLRLRARSPKSLAECQITLLQNHSDTPIQI